MPLLLAVQDVRKKKLGWKPTHVYLAASKGFDQNALKIACANGIECYESDRDGFKRLDRPDTD